MVGCFFKKEHRRHFSRKGGQLRGEQDGGFFFPNRTGSGYPMVEVVAGEGGGGRSILRVIGY